MGNSNPKGDQNKKEQPVKQPTEAGNRSATTDGNRQGNRQGNATPGQKGPQTAPKGPAQSGTGAPPSRSEVPPARQVRQPATAKPASPVRPGTGSNGEGRGPEQRPQGSADNRGREADRRPGGRTDQREPEGEVFQQRVFEPEVTDTVPGRGGRLVGGRDSGRDRPHTGGSRPVSGGGSSTGGGGGQYNQQRPPAGNDRRPAPTGGDQQRRQGPSAQPNRQGPQRGGQGQRGKRPQSSGRSQGGGQASPPPKTATPTARPAATSAVTELVLAGPITVRELAEKMHRSPIEVIKTLMNYGMMIPITDTIDFDTAQLIGEELGVAITAEQSPEPVVEEVKEEGPKTLRQRIMAEEREENLVIRPPVVVVLGHVDHGKTTLLDAIRETRVVEGEAGGITQHIGAYQAERDGRLITFLDTPGHEAFTAMRARGAMVTDIAVLVVAADDGVMPQTKEAIAHVKAAQVPIIVALNKVDKPQSNPDRVKQELADNGVLVEEYGGEVMCVPVSAKFRRGIGDLLESILLVADIEPQRANPSGDCVGTVIESRLDRTRGPMATLLVQNGTLHVGDAIVSGDTYAKIRAMYDDKGQPLSEALPATPVQILGLENVPVAGDTFNVVPDERTARSIATERVASKRAAAAPAPIRTLETIFAQAEAGQIKELNLILKADVQGSIEPIVNSLEKLGDEKLKVKILHQATGNITESDVMLAVASKAIILGFSVTVDAAAARMAEAEGVDIRQYNIIYNIIEDVQKALTGLLEPVYKEVVTGHAEVRVVFRVSKVGKVAGCYITDGEIARGAQARVKRGGEVLREDRIATLKRFQEDVTEVKTGFECGINLHNFNDFEVGDIIEAYKKERVS